ncbi:major facilitator superfamily domain-containing protein [Favolaschia claudopus]|uniref:Major facilitator superfamily domain-containing protein n=1 Tax=Favolaschia claudopus TaxID=2862362 RepID=A0AAV9ZUF3_9AGAR
MRSIYPVCDPGRDPDPTRARPDLTSRVGSGVELDLDPPRPDPSPGLAARPDPDNTTLWLSAASLASVSLSGNGKFLHSPSYPKRIVIGAGITQTINGFLTVVQVFYLPTFYQLAYGYSPVKSGLLVLPLTLVQTAASTGSGLIVSATGHYRELILAGWAVWAIGLGLLATLNEQSTVGQQIGFSLLTGIGVGQTFQPSLVAIQGALERKDMAVVTAMRSFARNIGGTIGLAITGTIVNGILASHVNKLNISEELRRSIIDNPVAARSELSPEVLSLVVAGYHEGFRTTFIILASLAAFAFVVALALMTHKDLHREDDARLKAEGKVFVMDGRVKEEGQPAKEGI